MAFLLLFQYCVLSFCLLHFLWANKTNNNIKQEINISWQHLALVKFTSNIISCLLCSWLGGWHKLICLRISVSILRSWTFITKTMSNMKPEVTIYWRYGKLTDEQIKFSAWHFDIKWQPFTNFLKQQDMLGLYMSSFTSFTKYHVLLPPGPCPWHFTHTVLLFLYAKKHYILENISKCQDTSFRRWRSQNDHRFLVLFWVLHSDQSQQRLDFYKIFLYWIVPPVFHCECYQIEILAYHSSKMYQSLQK